MPTTENRGFVTAAWFRTVLASVVAGAIVGAGSGAFAVVVLGARLEERIGAIQRTLDERHTRVDRLEDRVIALERERRS